MHWRHIPCYQDMALLGDLIKFIFGLRRSEILQLLNRLDDIVINMGTLGQVLKKHGTWGREASGGSLTPQRSAEGSPLRDPSADRRARYDVTQML